MPDKKGTSLEQIEDVQAPTEGSFDSSPVEAAPALTPAPVAAPSPQPAEVEPGVFVMPEGFCWAKYTGDCDVLKLADTDGAAYLLPKYIFTAVPKPLFDKFSRHPLFADYLTTKE